jgi:hypothetical protein
MMVELGIIAMGVAVVTVGFMQVCQRLDTLVKLEQHKQSYRTGMSTKPGRELLRQRIANRLAESPK